MTWGLKNNMSFSKSVSFSLGLGVKEPKVGCPIVNDIRYLSEITLAVKILSTSPGFARLKV